MFCLMWGYAAFEKHQVKYVTELWTSLDFEQIKYIFGSKMNIDLLQQTTSQIKISNLKNLSLQCWFTYLH